MNGGVTSGYDRRRLRTSEGVLRGLDLVAKRLVRRFAVRRREK